ncbi:hypothetical protein [Methylobacterium nigriterrae]|uniref:hypothetical protein n=1 Tax=Methylobacterium nigriterrae TaxID=3127512 RepID=UPI003013BF3F
MRGDRAQRPKLTGLCLAAALAAAAPASAQEPPDRREERTYLNNWSELRAALARCWQIPPGTEGSTIAFLFGLDRTGAIRGTPLVTARRIEGDAEAGRRYEEAARQALERCFPVSITPSFARALGESPIRLRFVNTPPAPAYQINSNITIFAPP